MSIPRELRYTKDHEWIRIDGDTAAVGITAYAAESLGDIVFVDPPAEGSDIVAGDVVGEIESTKSVSDLVAPASGRVSESNGAVVTAPETINTDPYGDGWIYSLENAEAGETLSPEEYEALVAGEQ